MKWRGKNRISAQFFRWFQVSVGREREREEEDKKGGGYNPSTLSTLSEWKRIHKRNDDDKEKRPQGEKVTCVSVTAVWGWAFFSWKWPLFPYAAPPATRRLPSRPPLSQESRPAILHPGSQASERGGGARPPLRPSAHHISMNLKSTTITTNRHQSGRRRIQPDSGAIRWFTTNTWLLLLLSIFDNPGGGRPVTWWAPLPPSGANSNSNSIQYDFLVDWSIISNPPPRGWLLLLLKLSQATALPSTGSRRLHFQIPHFILIQCQFRIFFIFFHIK